MIEAGGALLKYCFCCVCSDGVGEEGSCVKTGLVELSKLLLLLLFVRFDSW